MERLDQASEDDLRTILQALCKKPEIEKLALEHLDWLEMGHTKGWTASLKRKASDSIIGKCENCNVVINADNNGPKSCSGHTGNATLLTNDHLYCD